MNWPVTLVYSLLLIFWALVIRLSWILAVIIVVLVICIVVYVIISRKEK